MSCGLVTLCAFYSCFASQTFYRFYNGSAAGNTEKGDINSGKPASRSSYTSIPTNEPYYKIAIKNFETTTNDKINIHFFVGIKNSLNINIENILLYDMGV